MGLVTRAQHAQWHCPVEITRRQPGKSEHGIGDPRRGLAEDELDGVGKSARIPIRLTIP